MKNSLQNQAAVRIENDYLEKSAGRLLTDFSALKTQAGVSVKDNISIADRGVAYRVKNQQSRNIIEMLTQKNLSKDAKTH
jgi:hypothetical protein